jgi:polyisoprenoid-binding protein YceI
MDTHEDVARYVPHEVPTPVKDGALERWEIHAPGSRLGFALRHLVIHEIRGEFRRWGGTLFLDRAQPWLSSIHVWVDLASIDTDSLERDAHITSAEFLDVARFPRAEFESSSLEPKDGRLIVRGRLQLHGVTRDLDLAIDTSPRDVAPGVYTVRAKVDRQAFGLHWNQDLDFGGVVVGDEVALAAEVDLVH